MNIFQIPKIDDDENDNSTQRIIGVIDSSGSMGSYWPHLAEFWNASIPKDNTLTITFDTSTYICENNILDKSINKHGGGGTNIYKAFDVLEQEIEKIPKTDFLIVIFISDGQHNSGGDIKELLKKLKGNQDKRKINFLCLGVGSGFPTFISMKLRQIYHYGDDNVPAIFLIEYITRKAFEIKFQALSEFFKFNLPRQIEPKVCLFPWEEYTNNVFENSWVISNTDKVIIDKKDELDIKEFNLNMKGIQELFRSWAQKMQIESLKEGQTITARAKKTLAQMEEILEELKTKKKIDLLKLSDLSTDESSLTFKERAWNNFLRRNYERTSWFYNDVKNMASGVTANDVDQFEAAKKIGIGTIVGNYQQKINNLKTVTLPIFNKYKNEFIKILNSTKLIPSQIVPPYISIKKVLMQENFIQGLNHCKNPFDLVESFPLTGLPMRILKDQVDQTDVWNIKILFISKSGDYVDSAQIVQNQGAKQVKDGEQVDTVNTILPILTMSDEDLVRIFKTKLFEVVLSFNDLNNVDVVEEDAYKALLLTSIYELFGVKDYEWGMKMLQMLLVSAEVYLKNDQKFEEQKKKLKDNLLEEVWSNFENKKFLEAILLILRNKKEKNFEKENLKDFFMTLLFKNLKDSLNDNVMNYITGVMEDKQEGGKLNEEMRKKFNSFQTRGEFFRGFKQKYFEEFSKSNIKISVNATNLKANLKKYLSNLKNILKFCEIEIDVDKSLSQMLFMLKNTQVEEFYKLSVEDKKLRFKKGEEDVKQEYMNKLMNKNNKNKKNNKIFQTKQYQKLEAETFKEFVAHFRKTHMFILPVSKKEFQIMKQKNSELVLNKDCLLKNSCMAPNCDYYLKSIKRISHHMDIWGSKLPRGFHNYIFSNKELDVQTIFENIFNKKYNPDHYGYTEKEVLEYIKKIKEAYQKM